jgi:cytochrome P450 family 6
MNMVQDTIDHREKNNYTRNDFMQLLINLKNNKDIDGDGHDGKSLSMDELASQALVFFAAGFETSSTLMTFALYELARNEDVQETLRREIDSVLDKHDKQMTYDSIQDMKYLSQVIDGKISTLSAVEYQICFRNLQTASSGSLH